MNNLQVQGVYMITNKINNMFYIGSSVNIDGRWRQHKSKIRNKYHPSKDMINDYLIYGIEVFDIKVLEIVLDKEDLTKREQYWMEYYDISRNSYNTYPTAGSPKGNVISDVSKEKISKSLKGKNTYEKTEESKSKMSKSKTGLKNFKKRKPVIQYDQNGNIINEWDSVIQVCETYGWHENSLRKACNGDRKTYQGFVWKYKILN